VGEQTVRQLNPWSAIGLRTGQVRVQQTVRLLNEWSTIGSTNQFSIKINQCPTNGRTNRRLMNGLNNQWVSLETTEHCLMLRSCFFSTEGKSESKPGTESKSKSKPDSESKPESKSGTGDKSESKSNTEDEPEPNSDTKAKSETTSWFGWKWGRKHYEGGFQDKMNRKEAALILGVRANACQELILDRYRSLMRSNHPDLGGSPYVSGKINEAKEMLASRAKSDPQWAMRLKRRKERQARREARQEKRREAKEAKEAKAKNKTAKC